MSRSTISLLLIAALFVACNGPDQGAASTAESSGIKTTDGQGVTTGDGKRTCAEPPATELDVDSPLKMRVEPNPVAAHGPATLSIELGDLPANSIVGAGAAWQCWDGAAWMNTHQIVRGGFSHRPGGQPKGEAIEVEPGVATTMPAVGLPVPNSYPIMIPEVPPGTYRIVDAAFYPGTTVTGFVMVEVVAG